MCNSFCCLFECFFVYSSPQIHDDLLQDLQKKYTQMRRTRADGNCFFRAFGFAYLELLLTNREEYDRLVFCLVVTTDSIIFSDQVAFWDYKPILRPFYYVDVSSIILLFIIRVCFQLYV